MINGFSFFFDFNFYCDFIYIFENKEGEEFCGPVSSRNLKLNWSAIFLKQLIAVFLVLILISILYDENL